jgi:hypothetical protein
MGQTGGKRRRKTPKRRVRKRKRSKTRRRRHKRIQVKLLQSGGKKCPKGNILRVAYKYTDRSGKRVHVKSACIKDQGKPGKGPKYIPKLHKGLLTKYGYKLDKTMDARHRALKKAMSVYGGRNLIDKLAAIKVLNKSRKGLYKKISSDLKFVEKMYKAKKHSKKGGALTQSGGKRRRRRKTPKT